MGKTTIVVVDDSPLLLNRLKILLKKMDMKL